MEPEKPRDETPWVSDVIVDVLHDVGIEYVAFNPGASFRGIHDSLVDREAAGHGPEMIMALHEEHAVAIAHGYAKATGKPMAAAVHANVGLMHATMAIYDAWCDRVPMIVIGGTGPLDAVKRRPWIDGVHTATDQAALVRGFVKWDDQPTSAGAARESLLRSHLITTTYPHAPVYLTFDSELQESVAGPLPPLELRRYGAAAAPAPDSAIVGEVARSLKAAQRPVILLGRVGRTQHAWQQRIALAETIGARVVMDLTAGGTFPGAHPLLVGPATQQLTGATIEALRDADVVLSLDWIDLGSSLRDLFAGDPPFRLIEVTLDHVLWNGWSKDHGGLTPADLRIPAHPDSLVEALVRDLGVGTAMPERMTGERQAPPSPPRIADGLGMADIALALRQAIAPGTATFARVPIGWSTEWMDVSGPLDFLGYDGGAGVGSGPGMAVGTALALKHGDRLAVAVLGDGDTMMGITALWTAAHHRLPLLVIVANNHAYLRDVGHQNHVAGARGRDRERRWVGQRLTDPDIDFASIARGQGLAAWGPITTWDDLEEAVRAALGAVRSGSPALIDVTIRPDA